MRVVIADDVPEMRHLVGLNLLLDGRFEIVGEAATGTDLSRVVGAAQPDAVVLDLEMPAMEDSTPIAEMRATSPRTKIVIFSDFMRDARYRERAHGADAALDKSPDFDRLIETLAGLSG